MKAGLQSVECWIEQRLTLRWRLALWSAALLSIASLALVVFVNVVAQAAIPQAIAIPLLSTPPPPHSDGADHLTPVPFEAPAMDPDTVVKGVAVQQVQQATLRQVLLISGIGVTLVVGLGCVGAYWLAGRALHPVRNLAEVTRCIGIQELGERIALEGPQDEIKALAGAFDDMLARLERAIQQQDRFVGDVAHELRTPLATLRTNLEVIQVDPDATLDDYREMNLALERALTRLERLVADLLLLARDEKRIVDRLTLHRTGHHPSHKVTLQREENDQRQDHGDESAGREQVPVCSPRPDDLRKTHGQHLYISLTADEDQGNQVVIPYPEKLEDGKRGQGGDRKRQY